MRRAHLPLFKNKCLFSCIIVQIRVILLTLFLIYFWTTQIFLNNPFERQPNDRIKCFSQTFDDCASQFSIVARSSAYWKLYNRVSFCREQKSQEYKATSSRDFENRNHRRRMDRRNSRGRFIRGKSKLVEKNEDKECLDIVWRATDCEILKNGRVVHLVTKIRSEFMSSSEFEKLRLQREELGVNCNKGTIATLAIIRVLGRCARKEH